MVERVRASGYAGPVPFLVPSISLLGRGASLALPIVLLSLAIGCATRTTPGAQTPAPAAESTLGPLSDDPPAGKDGDRLRAAVRAMDEGLVTDAIRLLEELHSRHPRNAMVLHELALAYRMARSPERTIQLLMPYADRLRVETLASLGSALDEAGKRKQADAVLRKGLERFPRSGLLYSELATTLVNRGRVAEAIELYQHGIDVDPAAPANYLNLTRLLSKTKQRGLSLIYGETFRVLEPGSERSAAVGGVLVQICHEAVRIETSGDETTLSISLAPDLVMKHGEKLTGLPLVNAFELTFGPMLVTAHQQGFTLASLHRARRAFLADIKRNEGEYDWSQVPIITWLRALDQAGHLEAYDYWLFGPGLADEALAWQAGHRSEMEAMARFAAAHPLFSEG